jgi:hypothetical protein
MASSLSIDYDFFVQHEMHKEIDLPGIGPMSGLLVYDWQMSESRSPTLDDAVWRIRAMNFMRYGLDIQARMAPELSFADFSTELSLRMELPVPAWRGDSHGWAGIVARDYATQFGPLNVVNFDAHHDLGYGRGTLEKFHETGNIQCDDWALLGLAAGFIKNYTVVYPDWLGKWEWGKNIPRPWLKEFRNRIHITTWSDWLKSGKEIRDLEVAYLCRSSAWVPPWCDQGFLDLCEEFHYVECLDCEYGQHGSAYDTCDLRSWDWDEVNEEMKLREASFALLQKDDLGLTG